MKNTGRIRDPLDWRARAILFGETVDRALSEEFDFYVEIDRAHVVMLVERMLISRDTGRRLLTAIGTLVNQDYAPLRGRHAQRGLYLLYEHWLVETLGEEIGGAIHLGRSRNDMNATVLRLKLRSGYRGLVGELLRLLAALIRRAERYRLLTMPIYTHYQVALPITYGHYLAGLALALLRDLRGLEGAVDLDLCPLGAGAAGGTTVPIDAERTACLLGFVRGVMHSVDAVASRDVVLRLLGAAAVLGVTLSRIATDLQLWSTEEFGLISFPDSFVGSSSMMPQKRNAFVLEHILGRSTAPLGAFTAAVAAMHGTPFSNSIAVGTEGVRPLWSALQALTESVVLTRLAICKAEPRAERMQQRATDGFAVATEVANCLVHQTGMPFRGAHRRVGELVNSAIEHRESLDEAAWRLPGWREIMDQRDWLNPDGVVGRAEYGGGPASVSLDRILTELQAERKAAVHRLLDRSRQWGVGSRALQAATAELLTDSTLALSPP